jgi:hypothetical protein
MLTSGLSMSAPVGGFKFSTCQQMRGLKQEMGGKVKARANPQQLHAWIFNGNIMNIPLALLEEKLPCLFIYEIPRLTSWRMK